MMITMSRSLFHCFDLDLKGKRDSVTQVRFIGFGGISSFPSLATSKAINQKVLLDIAWHHLRNRIVTIVSTFPPTLRE